MLPRTGAGRGPERASTVVLGVAGIAAVANANFLLAPVVGAKVDLAVAVVSELSVAGQPGAVWFRVGDVVAGLGAALLAVPLVRGRQLDQLARLRAACLVGFGVGTMLSAAVPLPCAPSLGQCPSGSVALAVHEGVSGVATAGAVVGTAVLAWRTRRRLPRVFPLLATTAATVLTVTGGLDVAAFLGGGGEFGGGGAGGDRSGAGGLAQRVQIVAMSAWLVLEAVQIVRDRTGWSSPTGDAP